MFIIDYINDILVTQLNMKRIMTRVRAYVDYAIVKQISDFDKLDYQIVDSPPTILTGQPGVRYLVKREGDSRYQEYIIVGNVVYNIGTTGDINLDGYVTLNQFNQRANIRSIGAGLVLDPLTGELSSHIDFQFLQIQVNSKIANVNARMAEAEAEVVAARARYVHDIEQLYTDTEAEVEAFKDSILENIDTFKSTQTDTFASWFAEKRGLLATDDTTAVLNKMDDNYLMDFKRHYDLINYTTTVTSLGDGEKRIVTVTEDATQDLTVTTNADRSKTMVEVIIPTFGLYKYTKTTVIRFDTDDPSTKIITNTIEQSAK